MVKDILVTLLEDDAFSRNWMALLMVRDWRTRLVGEFSSQVELCDYLSGAHPSFDVLILDVDVLGEKFSIREICSKVFSDDKKIKILLTGVRPDAGIFSRLSDEQICGYVLKQEVGYSLSWVIALVNRGHWVLTPGTLKQAHQMNFILPENKLIVDGRKTIPGFTDHETEVARMAFIFSLGRRDLADELKITEQWSYGLVSELYKKMGLSEILTGETDLFDYIGESPIIRSHFEEIIEQLGNSKKAKDLETLAYHLITMPEIVK